jgi:hypothetical protein
MVVGEKVKRTRLTPFFTHIEKGSLRAEEQYRRQRLESLCFGNACQSLAERAIADLIVVLQKIDERRGR